VLKRLVSVFRGNGGAAVPEASPLGEISCSVLEHTVRRRPVQCPSALRGADGVQRRGGLLTRARQGSGSASRRNRGNGSGTDVVRQAVKSSFFFYEVTEAELARSRNAASAG